MEPNHLKDQNSILSAIELLDEGMEVLNNLVENIKRKGNYSAESTCVFIGQAAASFREASEAIRRA